MKKKVLLVCGTRPEIIKMAPVYKALEKSAMLEPVVLHTGQHTDLAAPLYEFFGMPPTESIDLIRQNPSLSALSVALLAPVSDVLLRTKPAAVLVHGDTSSAAMAALASFYEQIPVGHVEAGLRTNDMYSPFPEEMNRSLIGRMATWHYAPTAGAEQALLREGLTSSSIKVTGNTVIDAALLAAAMLEDNYVDSFVQEHELAFRTAGRRLVLVTAHRRENWGGGLEAIASAVADLLEAQKDLFFVWPLHANPEVARTVRAVFEARHVDADRLLLCPSLGYSTLVWLLKKSWLVMTDSGGIQEEAAAFGTPVLVLRDTTERPELIEAGGGVLVGAVRANIFDWAQRLNDDPALLHRMRHVDNPFGNGTAGLQICTHLEDVLFSKTTNPGKK